MHVAAWLLDSHRQGMANSGGRHMRDDVIQRSLGIPEHKAVAMYFVDRQGREKTEDW